DGTAAGTHLVKDLNAGAPGSFPEGMMAVGGKVYFSGRVGTDWKQWVTDGTVGGTKESAFQPQPGGGTINGKSVFAAFSSSGSQLWAASGTAAPSIIHDFGNVTGAAGAFVPFNGNLYFMAQGDNWQWQLWMTGGTTASTHIVAVLGGGQTL